MANYFIIQSVCAVNSLCDLRAVQPEILKCVMLTRAVDLTAINNGSFGFGL